MGFGADDSLEESPKRRRPGRRGERAWNLLTSLTLVVIAALALFIGWVYYNPYMPFNPYPPPTLPPTLTLPSSTPTPRKLPPTWTPTATLTLQASDTPTPTATEVFATLPGGQSQALITATLRPGSNYPYAPQGEPQRISSSIFSPELGCNWLGVAGQVFDLQGRPATGLTVQLIGNLAGKPISFNALTGTFIKYGQSGYEFTLADRPLASQNNLYVRLVDQSGLPLSERVYFDTSEDCQANLTLISFVQVR